MNGDERDPRGREERDERREDPGPGAVHCAQKQSRRIGPNEALEYLRGQYTQTLTGAGRLVMVSGGVASGKTQLLNDFMQYASASGALVLSATGAPDEQQLSGGAIDQLVASADLPPEVAAEIAAILEPATSTRVDEQATTQSTPSFEPVVRDVCGLLLRLAKERPTVIVVDDVQFVDAPSLRLLLQLQRRIKSTRMLIVVSRWDRPASGHQRMHAYFTTHAGHQVQLAPMSAEAVHDLVRQSLSGSVDSEVLARVHELSAGNPMLVHALIDDYITGEPGPGNGSAFSEAVHSFLRRCDKPLRQVAGALAVLGSNASADLAARLAGIGADLAEEVMEILDSVGLVAQGRFRHPDAGTAALESLPPSNRSQLHIRAAEVKYRNAAAAREVAAHLVAAQDVTPEWSVQILRDAADQAMLTDEVGFACECLKLALSGTVDEQEQRAIRSALARIVWRVNPSATSSYLTSLDQTTLDGAGGHTESIAMARHSLWHGDEASFTKALDAMNATSEPIDGQTAAKMRLAYQWCFGPMQGTEEHPANGDPWHHTANTLAGVWTRGVSEATTASAERILHNCLLDDTALEALATAILALVYDNKTERAEQWCAKLSAEAARRGAVTWQAMLDGIWAGVLLRRGEPARAIDLAHASLELLGTNNWGVSISYPLSTVLLAETAVGAFDSASEMLQLPVPDAMYRTVGGLRYLRARGQYHLATDRVLAAISDFQECRKLAMRWSLDLPTLIPWRGDLAEANLRLGNSAVARELARQQYDGSISTDHYSRGAALRVLAHTSHPSERTKLLTQAAEHFRRSGDRIELTRTLQGLEQHRRPGDPRVPMQRHPERRFTAGAAHPMAPVPASGHADGHRTNGTARVDDPAAALSNGDAVESTTLSEAELRVAQLAARGRTNRQIGGSLFITVSTVEQHLTRIYRKLRIRGRSDLPGALARAAVDGDLAADGHPEDSSSSSRMPKSSSALASSISSAPPLVAMPPAADHAAASERSRPAIFALLTSSSVTDASAASSVARHASMLDDASSSSSSHSQEASAAADG